MISLVKIGFIPKLGALALCCGLLAATQFE